MNPSLATRLRLVFGVLLVGLVLVATLGVGRLFELRQDFETRTSERFQLEIAAEQLRSTFILEQAAVRGASTDRSRARASFRSASEASDRALDTADILASGHPVSRETLETRRAHLERWRRRIARPILRGDRPLARVEQRLTEPIVTADNRLVARQREVRQDLREEVRADTRATVIFVLGALGAAFLAALVLFSGLIRAMRAPLSNLVEAARRLARGDLDARAEVGGPAETATLGQAFNDMASDLAEAYQGVEDERARLATMIASLGDGIMTVDRGGVVTLANPAARSLLEFPGRGSSLAEALGSLAPDDEALQRMISGELEGELRLTDGDRVLAVSVSSLQTRDGGTVLSVRDISERARVERMKDDFVATVSHELRSPLTSIKGFAELLLLDGDSLSQDQLENVRVIDESTARLVELVNDLLDLARSDAGRLHVAPRAVPVEELIDPAVRLLDPQLRRMSQTLTVNIEPGTPSAWADPARLRQVVTNLLTNAHQYAGEGARLEVSARPVGDAVQLTVSDDGPGISHDQQERLFERFWRGDAGERQAVGGSGLGLSIARSLIELHGGEITVDSEPGVGTSFHIVLPAGGPEGPVGRPLRRRVVVLAGSAPVLTLLARRLEAADLQPVPTRRAAAAADELSRGDVDAVLVALTDGSAEPFQLLAAMQAVESTVRVPVVVASVLAGTEIQGGRREVTAPLAADDLTRRLERELTLGTNVIVCARDPRLRARVSASFAAHGREPRLAGTALEAVIASRAGTFDLLLIEDGVPGAEATIAAIAEGWADGPEPRAVLLDETDEAGRPPTIPISALVDRVASKAEQAGTLAQVSAR